VLFSAVRANSHVLLVRAACALSVARTVRNRATLSGLGERVFSETGSGANDFELPQRKWPFGTRIAVPTVEASRVSHP